MVAQSIAAVVRYWPAKRGAGDIRVPVHERAGRILLPSPHVQRVERRQPEAVRGWEVVEQLPHQLRCSGVLGIGVPAVREHQVIRANQLQAAVRHRLVNHDLRLRRIDLAVADERHVDVVDAHRAAILTADAAKHRRVAFGLCDVDVLEALRRLADDADQRVGARSGGVLAVRPTPAWTPPRST